MKEFTEHKKDKELRINEPELSKLAPLAAFSKLEHTIDQLRDKLMPAFQTYLDALVGKDFSTKELSDMQDFCRTLRSLLKRLGFALECPLGMYQGHKSFLDAAEIGKNRDARFVFRVRVGKKGSSSIAGKQIPKLLLVRA